MALAGEGEGLVAVEGLLAGLKGDAARVGIEALGHVHLNAAELVHDVLQLLEVHLHVVGDGDAGEGGERFHGFGGAAEGIGGVDLLGAVALDVDHGVAGHRDEVDHALVGIDAGEHGHVRAAGRLALAGVAAEDAHVIGAVGLGGGQLLAELLELSVVETALDGGVDAVQVERERRAGTGENDDEGRGDAEGDLLAARLLAGRLGPGEAVGGGEALGAARGGNGARGRREAGALEGGAGAGGAGRARNVRLGTARTGGLGAPGAAAGARYGGGVGTAASLRGAEGRRVGAPARGAGVERSGMLARSVCHRVRRAGACLLDKHGGTNAKPQDTRKRATVGRLRQENRLLEGWWKGEEGVAEKGGALYNASY